MRVNVAIALLFVFSVLIVSAASIAQEDYAMAAGERRHVAPEQMIDRPKEVSVTELAANEPSVTGGSKQREFVSSSGTGASINSEMLDALDSVFVKIVALLAIAIGIMNGIKERSIAQFLRGFIPGVVIFNAPRIIELTVTHEALFKASLGKAYGHVVAIGLMIIMVTPLLMWIASGNVKQKPLTSNNSHDEQ